MAARAANVKGIKWNEEPLGSEKAGVATITYDLINTVYTGGADTVTLGGAGYDEGAATTLTLAQIMQNRRRDGKTVTILGVMQGPPGLQGAVSFFPQSQVVAAGNITSMTLNTAYTAGASVSGTVAGWDRPGQLYVAYTAI